jgi:phenylalanyl-tRNA synthetase beta chain
VAVTLQGRDIGVIGKLKPAVAEEYKARQAVWMAELDLEAIWSLSADLVPCFRQLPKFPASWRDMTLVAPLGFPVSDIMAALRASGQKLLEDVELVDEYKPKDASERNLTFRLTYRAAERTLTDQDVDKAHVAVGKHVTSACPVKFQAA